MEESEINDDDDDDDDDDENNALRKSLSWTQFLSDNLFLAQHDAT